MAKSNEFERFDAAVREVLSVSHDELKRREEEWKRERAEKKKKRKPKTSASGRASRAKG